MYKLQKENIVSYRIYLIRLSNTINKIIIKKAESFSAFFYIFSLETEVKFSKSVKTIYFNRQQNYDILSIKYKLFNKGIKNWIKNFLL